MDQEESPRWLKLGRHRVRSVMRTEKLRGSGPRRFKPQTTDSTHGNPISPNLLKDSLNAPVGQGEVLVGDIIYLRLSDDRFCYLCCLQDKYTRRIVSWKISERMTAQLVIDVFLQARRCGLINKGAIIHTDQGRKSRLGRIPEAAVYRWLSAMDVQTGKLLR